MTEQRGSQERPAQAQVVTAPEPRRRFGRPLALATALIFAGAGLGGGYLLWGNHDRDGQQTNSAAAATPRPSSAAGSPNPSSHQDFELKSGESKTTKGYALVQGDVVVDGKVLYDNNPKTGLIVEIDGGNHEIIAPFGADIQVFGEKIDQNAFDTTLGKDISEMKAKGCDPKPAPGCDSVNVVKIVENPTAKAVSTSTVAPSSTPDKSPATKAKTSHQDFELKPGEEITTKGFALVQGDVVVDGKVLYDNNPKTGLLVEIDGGTHKIVAPFGADIQLFGDNIDQSVFDATQGMDISLMKANGCDPKPAPGCDSVNVVKIK